MWLVCLGCDKGERERERIGKAKSHGFEFGGRERERELGFFLCVLV